MAATVRGAFLLIDRASGTLRKIEEQAVKTQAAVVGVGAALDAQEARSKKLSRSWNQQGQALRSFGDDLRAARKDAVNLSRAHDDLGRRAEQTTQRFGRIRQAARSLRADFQGLTRDHSSLLRGLARIGGGAGLGLALGGPVGGVLGGLAGAASNVVSHSGFSQFLQQGAQMKMLQEGVKGVTEAFSTLGSAFGALKIGSIVTAIGPLISSVDALGGGLIALLPKLGQVGYAMAAIPAAVSVAAQAFGTFRLAMSGIGEALQAANQMQNNWALNQQQWQQQVVQATDAVTDSQMRLNDSLYSERQAQLQLIIARRDATRQLQDMAFEAQDAILKEARAGLNIRQAQQELQQAMMTPGTTQLQLESDRLAVLEAQSSAQHTHTQALRSQVDYSRALRKDPTSEPVMKVANAQHQTAVATYEVARAQKSLQRSQYQLNFLLHQGNAGVQAYHKALMDLGPAGQAFVKMLTGPVGPGGKHSIVSQLDDLKNSAAKGLFPALHSGVRALVQSFGPLDTVLTSTGRVLGRTLSGVMKVFLDPKWILNTGGSQTKIIGIVGDGFVHLADALKKIITAGQPFLTWMARLFDQWAKHFDATRNIGAMEARFVRAEHAIAQVWHVLRNLWDAFKGVLHAASGLGDWLWAGAERGTKAWATWANSVKGQHSMVNYFNGLKPTLQAIDRFFKALVKSFVQLGGSQGQGGATSLFNTLTKLLPLLQASISGLAQFFPVIAQILGPVSVMLAKIIGAAAWLLKNVPGLKNVLAAAFVVGVLARFASKFSEMPKAIGRVIGAWRRYKREKTEALAAGGMHTPGTGGQRGGVRGFVRNLFGGGASMGMRMTGRPGSLENPLVVVGSGSSPGLPSDRNMPGGNAMRNAERDVKGVTRAEQPFGDALKAERALSGATGVEAAVGGGFLARTFAKGKGFIGGAGGKVSGLLGGVGSKMGGLLEGVGGVLSHVAGPLAIAAAALPGILSFIGTKGSFGTKLGAAASSTISGLTLGLVNPTFNAPSKAHQYAQGAQRAQSFFGTLGASGQSGLLTVGARQRLAQRLQTLQGQYDTAAHGGTTRDPVTGLPVHKAPDAAVRQDRYSQIVSLNKMTADQSVQAWTQAFQTGVGNGMKPQKAMALMMSGIRMQMHNLGPSGRKELLTNLSMWEAQMKQSNPRLAKQMDGLNGYIVQSFQSMGQNVSIVNGQILTGSQQQWQGISQALTDPMSVAAEKLNGTFGQIQQMAIGSLKAMGFSAADAKKLVGGMSTGTVNQALIPQASQAIQGLTASGAVNASTASTIVAGAVQMGSYMGNRAGAVGGRVMGSNERDVYQFGSNILGGGELVMNRHQEQEANSRLMRHGEPTVGTIVSNRKTPHWMNSLRGRATGGYINPIPGFTLGRTDQGVDASATPGAPIQAIGDSKMVGYQSDWYHGQPLMDFQLLSGPNKGGYWYVAEQITPVARMGQVVPEGGVVARFAPHGTGIEIGWAANAAGTTLAQATPGYSGDTSKQALAAGSSFRSLITGGSQVAPFGGTMAAKQFPALKAPQIRMGGVPGALANRVAQVYAGALTGKLRTATSNGAGMTGLPTTGGGNKGANERLAAQMLGHFGWGPDQMGPLIKLWNQESNWNASIVNKSSGAYGIPQSLPANKMASAGADWRTNPATQIKWGLGYIKGRYGSPAGAWAHEVSHNWYAGGGRLADAGWFGNGGAFTTSGPTVFGAGENGRERVTIEPASMNTTRPVHVEIHRIEVNRKGDVKKIVDEELRLLADSLEKRS